MRRRRLSSGLSRETLVVGTPSVRRPFEILKLASPFRVVSTLDDALKENGKATFERYAFKGSAVPEEIGREAPRCRMQG
jgi:hypothetical protein